MGRRNEERQAHGLSSVVPRSIRALTFAFLLRIVGASQEADPMLPLTKRQREILDYLNEFIQRHGYAPSLEEIGRRFNLSSLATVHKHLSNLQEKGFIKRAWNRSRSVELVSAPVGSRAIELPLLGFVAAGAPIEAVANVEKKVPRNFVTADGFGITAACRRYLEPLIAGEDYPPFKNGLPDYVKLRNAPVRRKLKTDFKV